MQINFFDNTTFGAYHSNLKTLFKQGRFGDRVKKGFYGENITPANVSIEHLIPRSQNGKDVLWNFVLASDHENNHRGCRALRRVINIKKARAYLEQFRGIVIKGEFNGNEYIRNITRTLRRMNIFLDSFSKVQHFSRKRKISNFRFSTEV